MAIGPIKQFTENANLVGINVDNVIDVTFYDASRTLIRSLGDGAGSPVSHIVSGAFSATMTTLNTP